MYVDDFMKSLEMDGFWTTNCESCGAKFNDPDTLGYCPDCIDSEYRCPGCACAPGDGLTEGCCHPEGCGYPRPQPSTSESLKPCPFCGSEASIEEYTSSPSGTDWTRAECDGCDAHGPGHLSSRKDCRALAMKAWNTRVHHE